MKLTLKLLSIFVMLMVLLSIAVGWFSANREWQLLMIEHEETAATMAETYRDRLMASWQQSGEAGVVEAVHGITHHSEFFSVRWVWFHSPEGNLELGEHASAAMPKIKRGATYTAIGTHEQGVRRVYTYVPIISEDDKHGGLAVSDATDHIERRLAGIWWTSLSMIVSTVLLSGLVASLFGIRWIGRPLEQLVKKTERASTGDFSEPVQLNSNDELGQLATSLNRMCDQLAQQRRRIHEETESRIAAMNQLRHSDRLQTVGQLSSGVAHELGTPLNVVLGNADLIASGKLPAKESVECAQSIKSEVTRMSGIVRNLLDFSRRKPGEHHEADLNLIIKDTVELLHAVARKAQVNLLYDSQSPCKVVGDSEQLKQVLMNLTMNAIQSMVNGGNVSLHIEPVECVPPQVSGLVRTLGKYFCVSVKDEGGGIAGDVMDRIFEPFFTTKDIGQGTGLGLSIAFGIIKEHDGWIDAKSEFGKGSCFSVFIPVLAPAP